MLACVCKEGYLCECVCERLRERHLKQTAPHIKEGSGAALGLWPADGLTMTEVQAYYHNKSVQPTPVVQVQQKAEQGPSPPLPSSHPLSTCACEEMLSSFPIPREIPTSSSYD